MEPLELGTDDGGLRHYLCGRAVHAGTVLEMTRFPVPTLVLALATATCMPETIPLGARLASVPTEDQRAADCGNGEIDYDEVCDDGFTDACGTCNADCSGEGSGAVCGDGVTCPELERCDDGYTDTCGTCNADCSGSGSGATCGDGSLCPELEVCEYDANDPCGSCSPDCRVSSGGPLCGDGKTCPGVEVCDDGFVDDCGTCNADCSGAGSGSTCGDGIICPETEVCDEDDGSPCGNCNLSCNGPGDAAGCVTGAFDPGVVYMLGQLPEGGNLEHLVVAEITNPNVAAAKLSRIFRRIIRPSDGRMLYLRSGDHGEQELREFHCDACPGWSPGDPVPQNFLDNDPVLPTQACDPASNPLNKFLIGPDNLLIYRCAYDSAWNDEAGNPLAPSIATPSYLSFNRQALGFANFGDPPVLIELATGGYTSIAALTGRLVMLGRAKSPTGFIAAIYPRDADGEPELWQINADATASLLAVYAPNPPGITGRDDVALGADGALYNTASTNTTGGWNDAVVLRPADGSASSVIYSEVDDPPVKLGFGFVTGP